MAYRRKATLSEDVPTLRRQIDEELTEIERTFRLQDLIQLQVLHSEPAKPRDGMVVAADGTNWDPGSGEGIYAWYNNQWNKL
jgi:hypothetical protein